MIEALVLFQALMILLGTVDAIFEKSSRFNTPDKLEEYPDMDVYVPIRKVNVKVLEQTIIGLKNQNYEQNKLHIYIIDDTPEKELSLKYQELSERYNVNYIYDPSNYNFKAGMVNIALKKTSSEFLSFFDFDQVPQPGILTHMISVLKDNPEKAFVQTKKNFRGLTNMARIWSALLYLQFFEVFEKTKNKANAVMFAGSTACFRRKYIDEVGGVPEDTFTEDNNLTLKLLLKGYTGIFSDRIGSIGLVPNGYSAQISQLWRWSHGGTHTLSTNFKALLTSKKVTYTQKMEFISTLGITPLLITVYLYTLSFFPLILLGYDSYRFMIGNISSLIFIPLAASFTYVVFATLAIWFDRNNELSEFKFKHLPGFFIIALASNFLIFTSGITGLLGTMGPKSPNGKWTRQIPILNLGMFSFILGCISTYFTILWLINGFTSAVLPFIMGLTLLPTIFIVIKYRKKEIES